MNIKSFFILVIIVASSVCCQNKIANNGYRINGTIENIPDGSLIKIIDDNAQVIDSTITEDEHFQLEGRIQSPNQFYLLIQKAGKTHYFPFWLENVELVFEGEIGSLQNSKIKGSELQKKADELEKKLVPVNKAYDSLNNLLSNKSIEENIKDSALNSMNRVRAEELKINVEFIKNNPNSIVSIFILNIYKTAIGKNKTKNLFESMSIEIRDSANGLEIKNFLKLSKSIDVGDNYIDFEQENPVGKLLKFSNLRRKITLLEFWASWCLPCRKSNPELVKIYENYKDKGFEIVAVSLDNNLNKWSKAIEKDNLPWVNLSDLQGEENEAVLIYGVSTIPDNFLIDERGVVIGRNLHHSDLRNKLNQHFSEMQDEYNK